MFERGDWPIQREENSGINWPWPFDRIMIARILRDSRKTSKPAR
jgi:hypothetical protein